MSDSTKEDANIIFDAVHHMEGYCNDREFRANLHTDTKTVGQLSESLKALCNLRFFTEPEGRKRIEGRFDVWFKLNEDGSSFSTLSDKLITWKEGTPGITFTSKHGFVPFSEMTVHIYS